LRQCEAHPPTAGPGIQRAAFIADRKPEAVHQLSGSALCLPGADRVELSEQLALAHAIFLGLGRVEGGLQGPQLFVAIDHKLDRRTIAGWGVLRDMGDRPPIRDPEASAIGRELTAQQGQQARFAATVRADEAELLAWMDAQMGPIEQQLRAAA
jgi:hypothetical protein